jgi:trehalose 6-phosphate phosphatase
VTHQAGGQAAAASEAAAVGGPPAKVGDGDERRGDAFREARARVLALVEGPPPLLVVTDFDGTLAPITLDPLATAIEPVGRRALRRLARVAVARPDRLVLVVLSGRLTLDVAGRIRVGGVRYLGNHGIEGGVLRRGARAEALDVVMQREDARTAATAGRVAEIVTRRLGHPDWLFLETKGPTVAFHYRQAADPDAAQRDLTAAIDAAERELGADPLLRSGGRRVIELRPETAHGKGTALELLLERERPGTVLVLGDDVSDAEAFRAAGAARERGAVESLAVAVHGSGETPPGIREAADVEVASPRDAGRLLAALAAQLERHLAATRR